MYAREAARIETLSEKVIRMRHIGSTSVPGMPAKPVIDILVEVRDIIRVDEHERNTAGLGHMAEGELGIPGQFFLKGEVDCTHHVHVFQEGDPEVARHLNFREYMAAHPDDSRRYTELTEGLAIRFRHDNDGYCSGFGEGKERPRDAP